MALPTGMVSCHHKVMKPKTCDEGPTALRNFTRTMQALFRVPKSDVQETKITDAKKTAARSTRK